MKRQISTSFRFDKKTRDSLDQLADALSLQRVQVVKQAKKRSLPASEVGGSRCDDQKGNRGRLTCY